MRMALDSSFGIRFRVISNSVESIVLQAVIPPGHNGKFSYRTRVTIVSSTVLITSFCGVVVVVSFRVSAQAHTVNLFTIRLLDFRTTKRFLFGMLVMYFLFLQTKPIFSKLSGSQRMSSKELIAMK